MLRHWRLEYTDRTFDIVTAPPLLSKDGFRSRLIRLYHQELLKAISDHVAQWQQVEIQEDELAIALYTKFGEYYEKIGGLFEPKIDVLRLSVRSRHEFFVASYNPVEHPETKQVFRGLSGVEYLLGMSYPFQHQDASSDPVDIPGDTGDAELNILTDATLIFKGRSLALAKMLSAEELALACRRANELMKPPEDREGSAAPIKETPVEDDPVFLANKEAIAEKLKEMAIVLPSGF